VDILSKKENIWPSGTVLALSPADMTQRTDSPGLGLNAKALFKAAIREQFRAHTSILKVLRLAKWKCKKAQNAHVHLL